MHTLLSHFQNISYDTAINKLLRIYDQQWYAVVNYVYGANIVARKLFSSQKNTLTQSYYDALIQSDLLFADGIAMQMFLWLYHLRFSHTFKRYHSINGTDFLPSFLHFIHQQNKKFTLILYGSTSSNISRCATFLRDQWYEVGYYQDGFGEFDRKACCEYVDLDDQEYIHILIQWRTTLDNPLQEIRTQENKKNIRQYNLIVFNQWGSFEHSTFGGTEKRAPKVVQFLKLERLRRTIVNPRKWWAKLRATVGLIPLVIYKFVWKR